MAALTFSHQLCCPPTATALFSTSQNSIVRISSRRCGDKYRGAVSVRSKSFPGSRRRILCRFGSPNFGYFPAGNNSSGDDDHDYVNSSVIDALELKHGSDGFLIKRKDGRYLRCVYNQPKMGCPPDYVSYPAMVLKLEDGSGLMLPIIVLETPNRMLMAALCKVPMARPTVYEIVTEMIDTMGYVVKYVRVTKRVHDAFYAELCVVKTEDETDTLTFDIRPSDAINIAARCKAPIQVNKSLAINEGLKVVEPAISTFRSTLPGYVLSEMDRPNGQPCPESEEFVLIRNMLIAAVEERYHDAAQWKDMLSQFRSRKQKWY